MSILAEVYASNPAGSLIIPALIVEIAGQEPIRVCKGFKNEMLGVGGTMFLFEAASITVSLPSRNTTGSQTLAFGIGGINERIQRYADIALETGEPVKVTSLEYLESDKTAPARRPYVMELMGEVLEANGEAQLSAGFFDVLNLRWSREYYTAENAPGIRYL